jgi:hypothetical protein
MNSQMPQNFFGRETELAKIQTQWEAIVSGKPESKSVSNILVITGSTGEGKTRLVQRFYETLAADPNWNPEKQEYYPKEFQQDDRILRVNPDCSKHDPSGPPRFIWLGMRWQNLEGRNYEERRCPIPEIRKELRIHIDQIKKNEGVWKNLWKTTVSKSKKHLIDGAKDAVIDLIPFASIALKAIGTFGASIYEANQLNKSRNETKEKITAGDIEALKDDLQEFFKSNGNIPLILFLDDAQWIDESTLKFIENFADDMVDNKLPVFIVVTHWIAEWNDLKDKKKSRNLRSICESHKAQVMDLSVVDDELLRKFLLSKLPGLNYEQQQVLIEKSCNNFLSLEENIGYLLDTPENFVDEKLTMRLSEIGEKEIAALESDRTKRIKSQFNKLEKDAKRVLGWSSHIGVKFLADVIKRVAKLESISSNLKVTFKKIEQRAYVSQVNSYFKEFRDKAIFRIAQNYFKTYDSRMKLIIKKSIKKSSIRLVNDSFDENGSVKFVEGIGIFFDNLGLIEIEAAERRDILGMMTNVFGPPNKLRHNKNQYLLRVRIIVLDVLNDYESDLIESSAKKAQKLRGLDWEYLPDECLGWEQKIKLCEVLSYSDCSEIAVELIESMEKSKSFKKDYLQYKSKQKTNLFARKTQYSKIKANALESVGRPVDALAELVQTIKEFENDPDFDGSRTQALRYGQLANAVYSIDMWNEQGVHCDEYFKKTAVMLAQANKIKFDDNIALLVIDTWLKKFYADNIDSFAFEPEAIVHASRECKNRFKETKNPTYLIKLADVYCHGAIVFSRRLKWKAFHKCKRRFNRVSKIVNTAYPNKYEKKLNDLKRSMWFEATLMDKMMTGDYKKLEKTYLRHKELCLENKTLQGLLDLGSSAYSLAQSFCSAGEYGKAIQLFYEAYSAYEEYFLTRQEFNVFCNLIRTSRFLLECRGIEMHSFTKKLFDNLLPKFDVLFAQLVSTENKYSIGIKTTTDSIFYIGRAFGRIGEYGKAKYFLEKALELYKKSESHLMPPLVIMGSIKALGALGIAEICQGNVESGLEKYREISQIVSKDNSSEKQKLNILFEYQVQFVNCLERCEINYQSYEIRRQIVDYWQYKFELNDSPENWGNLIESKIMLTKSMGEDAPRCAAVLSDALSDISNLRKKYPNYDIQELDEMYGLAINGWVPAE